MSELTVVAKAMAKLGCEEMPYVQALLGKVPDLLVEPPEIKIFEMLPAGLPSKGRF